MHAEPKSDYDTKRFDEEGIIDQSTELTPEMEEKWKRARGDDAMPLTPAPQPQDERTKR